MTSADATPRTRRMDRRLCNTAISTEAVMQCRQTRVNVPKSEAEGISTTAIRTEAAISDAPVCTCIALRFIDYQ
jgi:hypothetical protein